MDLDAAWTAFDSVAARDRGVRIVDQFAADPDRLSRLTVEAAGLTIDLSKQSWTREGMEAALGLAHGAEIEAARARLFGGEAVNFTEGRAVLHAALRARPGGDYRALGEPVSREVEAVRKAMADYAGAVRSGEETGATGKRFKAVVHVGIGGSDLGPRLVWDALSPRAPDIEVRFVANIDRAEMDQTLTGLNPETTLIIVVSKTFTTQETLANAELARQWLAAALPADGLDRHFIGVTAAPQLAERFGCGRTFAFRDWVGGRYSLWSAVGLSCAIGLGPDLFQRMLDGAAHMDAHFRDAPLERNAPVLMAAAEIWNVNGLGRGARTVAPYAHRLRRLAAFLQQLEMESNGKRIRDDGSPVPRQTCPVVFGEPGTNGQHAFFQQLHQGPETVPADFVIVARDEEDRPQPALWSNALAQAEALMVGKSLKAARDELIAAGHSHAEADRLAPHKTFPGNRPSTAILMERLTPETLGALLALYEHKVFVEGIIWRINSFDQWGVELGKAMARTILGEVESGQARPHDPSTSALIERLSD